MSIKGEKYQSVTYYNVILTNYGGLATISFQLLRDKDFTGYTVTT